MTPVRMTATRLLPIVFSVALLSDPARAQTLTLTAAIDSALATHPTLMATSARTEAASEARNAARAGRLPGVGFDASLVRFQEPMVATPIHSFDPNQQPRFDQTLVQARLGLRHTLFDAGQRSARTAAASAAYDGAVFSRVATEHELIERVTTAYVEVLSAEALLRASGAQVAALLEEASRARRHFDAGSAAEVEVLRATVALTEARAQETSARLGVEVARRTLARVMGAPAARVVGAPLADVPDVPAVPSTAARSNPLLDRADALATAARARASEERAGGLPKVDITAGLLDFSTPTDHLSAEWQAGVQLSWAVFSGGARSAAVRRADADVRAAEADRATLALDLEDALDRAQSTIEVADARANALRLAVTQWQELARIEALALDAGAGEQGDRLRAEAGLFQAQAGYARARHDAFLARVRLARVEGVLSPEWIVALLETSP